MADKPTASSYSAGVNTTQGLSPTQWSDKCFLCGLLIGETDPRGFYEGRASMALCHRGCLNVMHTHGGTPADYHRAMEAKAAPDDGYPPATDRGPGWLAFPDLAQLQSYVSVKGKIPERVRVSVAGKVIQDGA